MKKNKIFNIKMIINKFKRIYIINNNINNFNNNKI